MQILAHRGWWVTPDEKNSVIAFKRAFSSGYGVETDLRDHNGLLIIAHDLPEGNDHLTFHDFLNIYVEFGSPGTLALNIKADGLQGRVVEALKAFDVRSAFVFDMAVPDALGYLNAGVTTFTRQSEYETNPSYYENADGVWLDCFHSDWISNADLVLHLNNNKVLALVSPELHRRPYENAWNAWRCSPHENIMLCTDFPDVADKYFNATPKNKMVEDIQ